MSSQESTKEEAVARLEQLVLHLGSDAADSASLMRFADLMDPDALLQLLNAEFLESVNELCQVLDGEPDLIKLVSKLLT